MAAVFGRHLLGKVRRHSHRAVHLERQNELIEQIVEANRTVVKVFSRVFPAESDMGQVKPSVHVNMNGLQTLLPKFKYYLSTQVSFAGAVDSGDAGQHASFLRNFLSLG